MVMVGIAYLLGSIPTGYLVGWTKGIDIRKIGSGNIGATNVFRSLGKTSGIIVLGIDALKGYAACRWAAPLVYSWLMAPGQADLAARQKLALAAGIAAVLGHTFCCWLQFKGGKGIATTGGAFAALAPSAVLTTLSIWILALAVTRYVSVASITAAIVLPVTVWFWGGSLEMVVITAVIGLLAIYKHRMNVRRLVHGTEPRFGTKMSKPVS